MADRGGGHAQLNGRALEAQMPLGSFECPQLNERRKISHAEGADDLNSGWDEFFDFALGAGPLDNVSPAGSALAIQIGRLDPDLEGGGYGEWQSAEARQRRAAPPGGDDRAVQGGLAWSTLAARLGRLRRGTPNLECHDRPVSGLDCPLRGRRRRRPLGQLCSLS